MQARPRLPDGRAARLALAGTCAFALALTVATVSLALPDLGGVPKGTRIGGIDVGGRAGAEAKRALERLAKRRVQRQIVVVVNGRETFISGAELGARAKIDEALASATGVDALARIKTRLGISDRREIPLTFAFDERRLDRYMEQLAREVERPSSSARVARSGSVFVVRRAREGRELDRGALVTRLAHLPARFAVPVRSVLPLIGDETAMRAKEQADDLARRTPVVVAAGLHVELGPRFMRRAIRFEADGRRLAVGLDTSVLASRLRPAFRRLERRAVDASFRVRGTSARVVPAKRGRVLDLEQIASAVLASESDPTVTASFRVVEPRLTTAEARALGIRELVSSFTTPYACCEPRVENIQLAARVLDGTIIPPGGTFSLNRALGPRTPERGFVPAPMIRDGRLVESVGGGVSQIATTLYNAAFFAGLTLVDHTPHQFYISRYPMGREATVSWGGPELIFRNDWPDAVLIKLSAGETAVTARFFSTRLGRRVETTTGEPYDWTPAEEIVSRNPSLPRGARHVVQQGGVPGFTVEYARRVYWGDKLLRPERFKVRYEPEHTFVEVGPPLPPPKAKARRPRAGAAKDKDTTKVRARNGRD